ncbi:MAG: DUF3299 domain-containing protein [Pseudomonadota bacterium]
MGLFFRSILIGISFLFLLSCEKTHDNGKLQNNETTQSSKDSAARDAINKSEQKASNETANQTSYKTIEWIELMPKDDLEALMDPPSYVTDVEDGSLEDQISNKLQNTLSKANDDRYQQALVSTRVISEMNEQAIRIPGFVVPLTFDDDLTITQFFLVPFFGACIHVPPPPPNQVIFIDYPKGFKLGALHDPFWVSGILKTSLVENDMATAAYSMQMHSFEDYTDFVEYPEN